MASKMLPARGGEQLMETRIADHALNMIEIIRWAAIIIVMGLILSVIGASIYGSLGAMP